MSENLQNAAVHFGQEAIARFGSCLNSYFQDDATGKAYVIYRSGRTDLGMSGMTMCRTESIAQAISDTERIGELDQYEMIVVDSGNSHGDSWIATFYPRQCVMTFVNKLALQERPAKTV